MQKENVVSLEEKVAKFSLWGLCAISVVIFSMFIFGSSESVTYNNESYDEPVNTGALLYWVYALVGIATLATVYSAVSGLIIKVTGNSDSPIAASLVKEHKRSAFTSLIITVALVVLALITYAMSDSTPLKLIGYEGTENEGFPLQLADMCLYSIYALIVVAIIAAVLNTFSKKF